MAKHEIHHHHHAAAEIHHEHKKRGGESEREREHEREEHEKHARGGKTHETHAGFREVSDGHEMDGMHPTGGMGDMPEPMHEKKGGHPGHRHPGHPHDAKGGMMHHRRRARGGSTEEDKEGEPKDGGKLQVYNAKGSKEEMDAEAEKPEFKKGGAKRKHGGHASGEMAHKRLDRRPRRATGGRAADHSPYSSASAMSAPLDDRAGRGFEGVEKKT